MSYTPVIGLEVHLQLSTKTKLFCGCATKFGAAPNSQTCPVCLGLPGVLPVANETAFEWGIRVATAFDCQIAQVMKFDRKQYFYPDLPKNYQISQYDQPLAQHGWLNLSVNGKVKKVNIRRMHFEEDAGKLLHEGQKNSSLVDFNRTGVPLLEIVTEPDLRSPEEAYQYLVELKAVLQYLNVSTCNMEEGSLRCDANISVRPTNTDALGSKVEIKNLNSFRAVRLALEFEVRRQVLALEANQTIAQETRLWNEKQSRTDSMRSKEEASDYRYFPEPDLVSFVINHETVNRIKADLPELPSKRRLRFQKDYKLSAYDSQVLTQEKSWAELFEQTIKIDAKPKSVANWIMGELAGYLNANNTTLENVKLSPERLGHLLQLMEDGTLSGKMGKDVFVRMLDENADPALLVKEGGLQQISDVGELGKLADDVIAQHPKSVQDYAKGKESALMFLVGQAMKRSKGCANPKQMKQILEDRLKERSA